MSKKIISKNSNYYDNYCGKYFTPTATKYPPIKENALSDELYNKLMAKAKSNPGGEATIWIFIADAVSRGTITPLEAYDALNLGYLPENLSVRESKYETRL